MTDEARKVNKMHANIAAQLVDQALQDKAVRQERIDEHQIIFRTYSHGPALKKPSFLAQRQGEVNLRSNAVSAG